MKITNRPDVSTRYADMTRGARRSGPPVAETQGDAINISPAARMLREALQMEEPFNAEKVSEIRAAISRGEYDVDSVRLAEGLVTELKLQRGVSR